MRRALLTLSLTLLPLHLSAAPKFPPLEEGMSYQEVLHHWGPPVEKQEREASRKDVWTFAGGRKVTFLEGKALAVEGDQFASAQSQQGDGIDDLDLDVSSLLAEKNQARSAKKNQFDVEDILSEVMNDVSEEPEKKDRRANRKKRR